MIKKLLCLLFLLALPFQNILFAQQGKVDQTFNTVDDGLNGDGFNGTVRALLSQDENLIVGGEFLSLNGIPTAYFTRLKPDGTIDENFKTGTGFNGKVYSLCEQPDGKIIVGGSFTSYNGIKSGGLIRLNADGSYDSSFNIPIGIDNGAIYSISIQSDGKIIIGGSFLKFNSRIVNRIARILPDGSLDTFFANNTGGGFSAMITSTNVLSNGKILIVGNFEKFNAALCYGIVRLNIDGTIDSSFNTGTGFNGNVNASTAQYDNKIIIGGSFTTYNEISANRILRLNDDGSLDSTFLYGSGLSSGVVEVLKIVDSGNIMVGGSFTGKYNGEDVNRVVLLNADGTINTDFDIDAGLGNGTVWTLANDIEGSWFIGGSFSIFDGLNQGRLAKVNSVGEHDISYLTAGVGFDNSVLNILSLENKKAIVVGNFKKFNGNPAFRIARLLEDGSLDNAFNLGKEGANNVIKSAVMQSDGKIILGGSFTNYNNTPCGRIVRIMPDGSIDNAFNIGKGFVGVVNALALQSDQKIIAVGSFTSYNGVAVEKIIRLLPDGSIDRDFNIGTGFDGIVEAVLIQPDEKILVAGRFDEYNKIPFSRLIRLNSDGSIDSSFNIGTGFDKYIYTVALQSDQKIVVGGNFSIYNRISQKRILRLNINGALDTSFESGTGFSNGDVRKILVQPDDRILVGGTFSGNYKGISSLRLIRLLKTGNYDPSFSAPANNKIFALSFTADYRLLVGGNFNSISGISKHRIARLKLCLDSTIWDGVNWSNGFPSGGKEIFFKDNFSDLSTTNVCSCSIDEGKTVQLLSDSTLGIEFSYVGDGTLVLENNASLYQSDDDMVNTGNIIYKRTTSPVRRYDQTYWSSPVTRVPTFTLHDLSPNTLKDKYYKYDPIIDNWAVIDAGTEEMGKGIGYNIRAPQSHDINIPTVFNGLFTGVPNNGKVSIPLGGLDKWVLLGNPYPSAVYADQFIIDNKDNLYGTLYFWTHNTSPSRNIPGQYQVNYSGDDYALYNLTGSISVGLGAGAISDGNQDAPTGYISAGQAFFARSRTAFTAVFKNSMRIPGFNGQFFKTIQTNKSNVEKHRVWLNLTNIDGAFKQILIGYVAGATNSWDDNYDGLSLNGNKYVDFYSIDEGRKLVIQGREAPFSDADIVPLGYRSVLAGNFTIAIDHTDGELNKSAIYLEDKTTGLVQDLTLKDYTFTTPVGTFNDRFILRYSKTLGIEDLENLKNKIFISVKNKIIKVRSISNDMNFNEVEIYDVSGKIIYTKKKIGFNELEIANLKSGDQVLFLKITLENGNIETQKIIF